MRPQDLKEELRKQPFEPIRLHLSDGTSYELRHPDLVMVGRSKILIGTPAEGVAGIFERYYVVSPLHVVRLEPIEPPTASASS